MAEALYTPQARRDLADIEDYITDVLCNPIAAANVLTEILDKVDQAVEFPNSAAPLSSIANVESDYRVLVCGNYLAFFRIEAENIRVIRVLYGKSEYIKALFG